jgi:hypothetical protein
MRVQNRATKLGISTASRTKVATAMSTDVAAAILRSSSKMTGVRFGFVFSEYAKHEVAGTREGREDDSRDMGKQKEKTEAKISAAVLAGRVIYFKL